VLDVAKTGPARFERGLAAVHSQLSISLSWSHQVVQRGLPVVIRSDLGKISPALKTWTPDNFARRMPEITYVYRQRDSPVFKHFTPQKPLASLLNITRRFEVLSMSGQEFFSIPEGYVYWSGRLDASPLRSDLGPESLERFTVGSNRPIVNLWMSNGVTASCHYGMDRSQTPHQTPELLSSLPKLPSTDEYNNFFVQIFGEKEFLLFDPVDYDRVRLFPLHHPYHRQSQLDLQDASVQGISREGAWTARVRPGDILYLPPFWFHHGKLFKKENRSAECLHFSLLLTSSSRNDLSSHLDRLCNFTVNLELCCGLPKGGRHF
jgi:hypothetical protein